MAAQRRRPRGLLTGLGLSVTTLALIGTAVLVSASASSSTSSSGTATATATAGSAGAASTATVTRQDLVRTEKLTGSLSFGESRAVATSTAGVVTSVAAKGTQLKSGDVVYSIDMQPTVLLSGIIPAYRALDTDSSDGGDVTQLEQALVDLGYGDGVTVDQTFDSDTATAVTSWEESLGRSDPDGTVELGDILFSPGTLQVAEISAPVGAQVQARATILRTTAAGKQIDLDVDVDRANDIAVGTPVTLDLPDGSSATGTVTDVGTTPETNAADPTAAATVPVVVVADSAEATACCTSGSVDVTIERSREADVLVVPVAALLALAEGGYAVEVVDPAADTGTRLVAVEPGTYADKLVSVTGVDEGTEVVVAG